MAVCDPYLDRKAALLKSLSELSPLAIAFSGGVDSSVLCHAAVAVLGDKACAVIADSASLPRRELIAARETAIEIGIELVELRTDEQLDPAYQANQGDRCYFCKAALFRALDEWRQERAIPFVALGEIADDAFDDRPGQRAAQEHGVQAPLAQAGFSKQDVRRYAAEAGLNVADKPASACLASRIPVGTVVSVEALAQVEAAENALMDLGLSVLRVRHQGSHARVELGAEDLVLAEREPGALGPALALAGFETHELARYLSPFERLSANTALQAGSPDQH